MKDEIKTNSFEENAMNSKYRHAWRVQPIAMAAALLAVGISAPTLSHANGYDFRIVAKLGDPAPGGGACEGDFEPLDINASGTAIFACDLEVGGSVIGEGLYRSRNGVSSLIARSGDPAPGTSVNFGPYGILSPGGMNGAGDVAFGFTLDVPFTVFGTNAGVWRYSRASNAVTKVLLPGDTAPGGTTFRGTSSHTDLNNRGEIATVGIIDTPFGNCTAPGAACLGLGRGVYKFDSSNNALKIAAPGDPAPGSSSTFNDAWAPNINERGDVVFGGHVSGEFCVGGSSSTLGCYESLYLYRASTGTLSSIAHQGDPEPGGSTFLYAFNGRLNSAGDASFIGGLNTEGFNRGVYLYQHAGSIVAVARPGDSLPGGTMVTTTNTPGAHGINAAGDVAFVALLNADKNHDGVQDTGVYLYHAGKIRTVVRTGTVIPGLGTVAHTNNNYFTGSQNPWPGVHLNNRGEVLTQVILTTGDTYVVVATPREP